MSRHSFNSEYFIDKARDQTEKITPNSTNCLKDCSHWHQLAVPCPDTCTSGCVCKVGTIGGSLNIHEEDSQELQEPSELFLK